LRRKSLEMRSKKAIEESKSDEELIDWLMKEIQKS
jgi:hypothetical protein